MTTCNCGLNFSHHFGVKVDFIEKKEVKIVRD